MARIIYALDRLYEQPEIRVQLLIIPAYLPPGGLITKATFRGEPIGHMWEESFGRWATRY